MKERSAGGMVYRHIDEGVEILLIEDRFGKMTLPKGHLEGDETWKEAALREVEEETGMVGIIVGEPLGVVSYEFEASKGVRVEKEVHYFLVEAVSGVPTAQIEEIRDLHWVAPEIALHTQYEKGYNNNDQIVERALTRLRKEDLYAGSDRESQN